MERLVDNGSLFITPQYLRTEKGNNKYHWGIFVTYDQAPEGILHHATDVNRAPLDLYYEARRVTNPSRSKSMIVCLKVSDLLYSVDLCDYVATVPLMSRSKLPPNEARWTCRVWVKESLDYLRQARVMDFKPDVDTIERCCYYVADGHLPARLHEGKEVAILNNPKWIDKAREWTRPSDQNIESRSPEEPRARYYGPKPMDTEPTLPQTRPRVDPTSVHPTAYYGPEPMVTERATTQTQRHSAPVPYYGPKPMITETTLRYRGGSSSRHY